MGSSFCLLNDHKENVSVYNKTMIIRELKLKLTKEQESLVLSWLNILTGVYNWAIRKIELDAKDRIYHNSDLDFKNLLVGHSKRLGIPSNAIQSILNCAWKSWRKFFDKKSGKPKFKGARNKLNSIPYPAPFKRPECNRIHVSKLGKVKFHKQSLPEGKIKCGALVKRASGYYLILTIDANHNPKCRPIETKSQVGIDTGFKTLITCSDGAKYDHPKELQNSAQRLAQAQRGNDKYLAARLQERQKNQRKDRNHKISTDIVNKHAEIYITNDNLRGMARSGFGKSVAGAAINQLRRFIIYKGSACGRQVTLVDSRRTTMTCSECGALTGPRGRKGLKVRDWECRACGAQHDRDVNAARVVLMTGLGLSLESGWKATLGICEEQMVISCSNQSLFLARGVA